MGCFLVMNVDSKFCQVMIEVNLFTFAVVVVLRMSASLSFTSLVPGFASSCFIGRAVSCKGRVVGKVIVGCP